MKIFKRGLALFLIICMSSIVGSGYVSAEKVGSGARIIIYGEPGAARFRLGGEVGEEVKLTAEPTGSKTLSDISFATSDSTVCSIKKEANYWLIRRLKEGTAVIRMSCKADTDSVARTLLMSNLTYLYDQNDEYIEGYIKANTTVYWGCSDVEGITSYDTEKKCSITRETPVDVVAACGDYYRVELKDGTFGDTEEEWGYVKKKDVSIPVTAIVADDISLYEKEQAELNVVVYPDIATNQKLSYVSSNINVATVAPDGKVTAKNRGLAVVTITSDDNPKLIKKCRIEVKPYYPVTGIQILPDKSEIDDGKKGKITVKILPEYATVQDFSWNISDESVLQVDSKGRYLARKPGTVTVRVTSKEGGFTDSCQLRVKDVAATGIYIQPELSIDVHEVKMPAWNMVPSNATNKNVTFRSENPAIAKVDKTGRITGMQTGKTTIHITSKDGKYTKPCKVTVERYIDNIWLKETIFYMTVGTEKTLALSILPENRTIEKIIWKSSDSSIAVAGKNGKIKAIQPGKARIMVYDRYTGAYDYALLTVKATLSKPKIKAVEKKNQLNISWKSVKRATGYILYRYDSKTKTYKKIKQVSAKTKKAVITNLNKKTIIKMRAFYQSGTKKEYSKYSNKAVYKGKKRGK